MIGTYHDESDAIRPMHAAMVCTLIATLAGGCLLLSAAESTTLVDGAVDWQVESPLRAVVQLLCLDYRFPTIHQGTVKNYILGLGSGMAMLIIAVALLVRQSNIVETPEANGFDAVPVGSGAMRSARGRHIAPAAAAQILVCLYLLWSFASSRWSAAPDLAVGGSVLLAIQFLWAMGLGNGLNRTAALMASRAVVIVTVVTAAVALWYFYGRNPAIRAKFPFGNPSFLAACLIPGILLIVSLICQYTRDFIRGRMIRSLATAVALAALLGVCVWAFALTKSRGPALGLATGLAALAFFSLRGRARLLPVGAVMCAVIVAGLYFFDAGGRPSAYGRGATVRFRTYVWGYAWDMFKQKPLTGHGQGGFALSGDTHAVNDVLVDPLAFGSRVAHAHNEWLEVMADLGAVGFALVMGALFLTFRAGMAALRRYPSGSERWAMIGLLSALAALIVEEAFGVGLRVSGTPTIFYTVVGLIWAMAGARPGALVAYLSARTSRRLTAGGAGIIASLATLAVVQNDFAAARVAYGAGQALRREGFEEAVRLASTSMSSLSPQRTLENLARLAEAHVMVATELQQRAFDRETRARESDLPSAGLLALARQDREASDSHCAEGSRVLKELVARSPGYFRHGQIEYELNLIQADNAAARNDDKEREQCIKNAAAAIERELRRRPFSPSVTLEYLSVAGDGVDLARKINILARPLRHNRLTAPYVDFLARLTTEPNFGRVFERLMEQARQAVRAPSAGPAGADAGEPWAPEKLRLEATLHFRRGNYNAARESLESAAKGYETLAGSAPIGAASAYAELADGRFYAEPENPRLALESAERALAVAPESLAGRTMRQRIKHRMVDYYLAGDQEAESLRLLREFAPAGATEQAVQRELGYRYRGLCESMLSRREALLARRPAADLFPKMAQWSARAIELNPDDPMAHYLAADLALSENDCGAAADHLLHAINKGLEADTTGKFLEAALHKKPDCWPLQRIWSALTTAKAGTP